MSLIASLSRRLPRVAPEWLDRAAALALSVGAVADVASLGGDRILAAVPAIVCTTAVAWRRRAPVAAAIVSLGALAVYSALTRDPNLTFEPYAVLLTSYTVGRRRSGAVWALLLLGALGAFAVSAWRSGQGGAGLAIGATLVFTLVPLAVGRLVARHSALAIRLERETLELQADQESRARAAAEDQRFGMARELHDVVAHCVSVMVIQASAARLVAAEDVEAARGALAILCSCGRDALDELGRLGATGDTGSLGGGLGLPRISRIGVLAERAQSAGVPTSVRIAEPLPEIPDAAEAMVFRVVQEALTNTVKHAPGATATVDVGPAGALLEVTVTDTGPRGFPSSRPVPGARQGLDGLRERVGLFAGTVHAGPRADGGWSVTAQIPLHRETPNPPRQLELPIRADVLIAAAWLVALEVEVVTSSHRSGPLWLNAALVGAMALAFIWRRRSPLLFLVAVGLLGLPLTHGLTSRDYATLTGLYSVLVPNYTVAAWSPRRQALAGLALWGIAATALGIAAGAPLSGLAGPLGAALCAWVVGRLMRADRELVRRLRHTSDRLVEERDARVRRAAIQERVRIAADLGPVVAADVSAMISQAEGVERLLAHDVAAAIPAIEAVEAQGRQTLVRVRLILGVLRNRQHTEGAPPPPPIDRRVKASA